MTLRGGTATTRVFSIGLVRCATEAIIEQCGGVRAAGRMLGVDPSYLSDLRSNSSKTIPSDAFLGKLNLRKVVAVHFYKNIMGEPTDNDLDFADWLGEIDSVVACLGDDAAKLAAENEECEMAANMVRAAELLERLLPRTELKP